MKLLELITYCELKGLILSKHEVDVDWDTRAESHWKVVLRNGQNKVMLAYAVVQDTGVVISASIHKQTSLGVELNSQASRADIEKVLLEQEHATE